jgi:hypothetical protein
VAIFWPIDESGTLMAEDSYGSSDLGDLTLVPDDELPADYVSMLEVIGFAGRGADSVKAAAPRP